MRGKRIVWAAASVLTTVVLLLGVFGCSSTTPAPAPTLAASPSAKPAPSATATPAPAASPSAKPAPSATATPAPAPAKTFTLKAGGYGGTTYPLHIMMEEAHKMIEERSKGQIKIQWFPNQSLVKATDMYTAIPGGVLDIGVTSGTYKEALGLPNLMVVFPFAWDLKLLQDHYRDPGSWFDFQQPYWEKLGMHLLSQGTMGYLQLGSRTPIHKLADFKGKLIRVAGLAPAVKALGAEPVNMRTTEIYEALQRGTIDGTVDSFSTIRSSSIQEVAKYFTQWDLSISTLQMVMSTKVRQELPADLVKLIDQAYLEAERNHNARVDGIVKDDTEFIRKSQGVVEIYQVPDAERALWKEAVKPMLDDVAKKTGAAEWDRFLPILKSLSK